MLEVKLSPPWYTFANEVKETYGASPYVTVSNLVDDSGEYVLVVKASRDNIATALRRILPVNKSFGNVNVRIEVENRLGNEVLPEDLAYTAETLATTFCTALRGNPLFIKTIIPEQGDFSVDADVIVVIKKEVIQFYNDDLSDYCRNFNGVAADVFEDVSTLEYPTDLTVSFTTYDCNCENLKNGYCYGSCGCSSL